MSDPAGMRRAVAEVRWDNDPGAILWLGGRPLPHFWPMVSAYFRDILLPPHRRAEEEAVSWSWREPRELAPLTPSDLRALRKRLELDQQALAENFSRTAAEVRPDAAASRSPVSPEELVAGMAAMIRQLVARSDVQLAAFVCRTENGLRLHSWAATAPARPWFPDTVAAEGLVIAGQVLVRGRPALHDVLLETADGEMLAETPSDASGAFRFPKLAPGRYRLRARSTRGTFPPRGLLVEVTRSSVTHVVLADDAAPAATSDARATGARGRSTLTLSVAAAIVLIGVGGTGVWLWREADRIPGAEREAKTASAAGLAADISSKTVASSRQPGGGADTGGVAASVSGSVSGPSDLSATALAPRANAPTVATAAGFVRPNLAVPGSASSLPGTLLTGSGASGAPIDSPGEGMASKQTPGAQTAASAPSPASAAGGSPNAPRPSSAAAPANVGRAPSTEATAPAATSVNPPMAAGAAERPASKTLDPAAEEKDRARPENVAAGRENAVAPGRADVELRKPDFAHEREAADAERDGSPRQHRSSAELGGSLPDDRADARNDEGRNLATRQHTASPAGFAEQAGTTSSSLSMRWPVAGASIPLTRTVRIRVAPWRVRLLEDAILPTQPMRAGQMEPVELLRQRLLAEHRARIPRAFAEDGVRTGIVVQWETDANSDMAGWVDASGNAVAGAHVKGNRAELVWTPAEAPTGAGYRLRRRDGVVVAELRFESDGRELVVRTIEAMHAWMRWAVPAETDANVPSATPRLAWRTGTGASLPPAWRCSDKAEKGTVWIDLPLGGTHGAVALQRVALLDRDSGWALAGELRQGADRPLGE